MDNKDQNRVISITTQKVVAESEKYLNVVKNENGKTIKPLAELNAGDRLYEVTVELNGTEIFFKVKTHTLAEVKTVRDYGNSENNVIELRYFEERNFPLQSTNDKCKRQITVYSDGSRQYEIDNHRFFSNCLDLYLFVSKLHKSMCDLAPELTKIELGALRAETTGETIEDCVKNIKDYEERIKAQYEDEVD